MCCWHRHQVPRTRSEGGQSFLGSQRGADVGWKCPPWLSPRDVYRLLCPYREQSCQMSGLLGPAAWHKPRLLPQLHVLTLCSTLANKLAALPPGGGVVSLAQTAQSQLFCVSILCPSSSPPQAQVRPIPGATLDQTDTWRLRKCTTAVVSVAGGFTPGLHTYQVSTDNSQPDSFFFKVKLGFWCP